MPEVMTVPRASAVDTPEGGGRFPDDRGRPENWGTALAETTYVVVIAATSVDRTEALWAGQSVIEAAQLVTVWMLVW